MTFIFLLFGSALFLSAVAAFYSIVGLVSIFPAAEIPIIIMGVSLEICKLVAASWLYRNWETAPSFLKYYFSSAVIILSFITSMGIFGFLSKAHIEQTTVSGDTTDINLTRISREDYLEIPNKTSKGQPSQYFLDRQRAAPVIFLYPTPDDSTDVFKFRRSKKVEDITASNEDIDVPDRFYPCLISGLAYYLSLKRPQIEMNRRQELRLIYEEEFDRAATEDREKVDLRIMPVLSSY